MNTKTLTIGGGCFWCTEAVFREIEGIADVKSGYSGGQTQNPGYREVCSGRTGHAEVVQVTYDPQMVSLDNLLLIHLVTHNPTTPNQQGADKGTQYRSVIFFQNDDEKQIAYEVIKQVQTAYPEEIVTELRPFEKFYEAEIAHQEYYQNNPNAGYCRAVIAPKLAKFREIYSTLKKDLVNS